jgi:hypothetical protein
MSEATSGFSPAYRFAHAGYCIAMTNAETAAQVLDTLRAAEHAPPQAALPMLNGLVGLVQASGAASLEVEEARAGAFMAICEIGKALHRGQPTDALWPTAIAAAERWNAAR